MKRDQFSPRLVITEEGKHRVRFKNGEAPFLTGVNKAWFQFHEGWHRKYAHYRYMEKFSKSMYAALAVKKWMSERLKDMDDFGFNMVSKLWQGPGKSQKSYQPKPYDKSFGWWHNPECYKIAEKEKRPHIIAAHFFPPRYCFESYSKWPQEVKDEQFFPDVWSTAWIEQVTTQARQLTDTYSDHEWLIGCVLGVEPPFVCKDVHLLNPGAWNRPTWIIKLWGAGPTSTARAPMVDALKSARLSVSRFNKWVASMGGTPVESFDDLYTQDPIPLSAFSDAQLPSYIINPFMNAISTQYHSAIVRALRSSGWRHLIGSADFAGNALDINILKGASEGGCDFFATHEYCQAPKVANKKTELLALESGLPYFVLEFTHIDDSQNRKGPPGYPHVKTTQEKIDNYHLTVNTYAHKAPHCLGTSVHSESDHVTRKSGNVKVVDQWGYVTKVFQDIGGAMISRRYTEYQPGIKRANDATNSK